MVCTSITAEGRIQAQNFSEDGIFARNPHLIFHRSAFGHIQNHPRSDPPGLGPQSCSPVPPNNLWTSTSITPSLTITHSTTINHTLTVQHNPLCRQIASFKAQSPVKSGRFSIHTSARVSLDPSHTHWLSWKCNSNQRSIHATVAREGDEFQIDPVVSVVSDGLPPLDSSQSFSAINAMRFQFEA